MAENPLDDRLAIDHHELHMLKFLSGGKEEAPSPRSPCDRNLVAFILAFAVCLIAVGCKPKPSLSHGVETDLEVREHIGLAEGKSCRERRCVEHVEPLVVVGDLHYHLPLLSLALARSASCSRTRWPEPWFPRILVAAADVPPSRCMRPFSIAYDRASTSLL